MTTKEKQRILVAPLYWGLGHATRCIPIIKALIAHQFEPVIASDGAALQLLKKEFPNLQALALPAYNISYSKSGKGFKRKLIKDAPNLLKIIKREKAVTQEIVKQEEISGIISDNRFGVYHKEVPSVFITHQLRVLSGNTTWLSSKLHQKVISKFDACWVPDTIKSPNLSGLLGHLDHNKTPTHYIGPLSRFEKKAITKVYDLLIILSGPEPQRTLLEEKIRLELKNYNKKVCLVRGVIEAKQHVFKDKNISIYNFMTSTDLEFALNASTIVLSRSGYTSIMDYAKLEKKAFLIPTPGQFEQEYLAKKYLAEGLAPSCKQEDFKLDMLKQVAQYSGFSNQDFTINYKKLFNLF